MGTQSQMARLEEFFHCWQNNSLPELRSLTWPELEHGMNVMWTRAMHFHAGVRMIPGPEFFNTAHSKRINTAHSAAKGELLWKATKDIDSGAEVYDAYGKTFSNELLLNTWGLYLEDN